MLDPAPTLFKDHFSTQSAGYQKYRPDPPLALFEWLAAAAPGRSLALDVGSGNGQAAVALAEHFDAVIATEPSAAQLAEARPHPRVKYRQESAEAISLAASSADLVVAAQAAHWFDWPRFTAAAGRVLRPGGVLAIWCYDDCEVTAGIDRLRADFSRDVVGPYWPRERRHVEEGYRDLELPVAAARCARVRDAHALGRRRNARLRRHLVRRAPLPRAHRPRPAALLARPLADAWGPERREMHWPLTLKAGRA